MQSRGDETVRDGFVEARRKTTRVKRRKNCEALHRELQEIETNKRAGIVKQQFLGIKHAMRGYQPRQISKEMRTPTLLRTRPK